MSAAAASSGCHQYGEWVWWGRFMFNFDLGGLGPNSGCDRCEEVLSIKPEYGLRNMLVSSAHQCWLGVGRPLCW